MCRRATYRVGSPGDRWYVGAVNADNEVTARKPATKKRPPRAPVSSVTNVPGAGAPNVPAAAHPTPLPSSVSEVLEIPGRAALIVPPKPPLPPARIDATVDEEPEIEPRPDDEPDPIDERDPIDELKHESEPEREPESAPEAQAEPEAQPSPDAQAEYESEREVESDREPELDAAAHNDDSAAAARVEASGQAAAPADAAADAEASTAPPALSVRGLTKIFGGSVAVDAIDLTVPAGSFYGLVGPNGAGKTTTLSMIAGLLKPDRGTIEICGINARTDPAAAKRLLGVLPDRLRTFDRLTGRQLLYYYGILRGLRPDVVESRTADLARAFDLTDALGRVVSDYSAGMTKKVMLAGAMIHSPRLLVLDEPFEAVDPVSSSIILDILGVYVSHGGTVILSSHGMDLVERVCSRVGVIVGGQALAEGTVDEVRGELTLEQRFVELAGGLSDVEGLEWLHTFSG